jgi:hypothetical protein
LGSQIHWGAAWRVVVRARRMRGRMVGEEENGGGEGVFQGRWFLGEVESGEWRVGSGDEDEEEEEEELGAGWWARCCRRVTSWGEMEPSASTKASHWVSGLAWVQPA